MNIQNRKIKVIILILSLAMFSLLIINKGTLSYLTSNPAPLLNSFEPGFIKTEVIEEFDFKEKKNVKIKNNGNVPAYIRSAVIINWNCLSRECASAEVPVKDKDYTIEINENDWFKKDGYYYYKHIVLPNEESNNLVNSLVLKGTKSNMRLVVDVLSSGIQSVPEKVVEEIWNVKVNNKVLSD